MHRRLDNDKFLVALAQLFDRAESEGSVYLNQKRLTHGESGIESGTGPSGPFPVIFRASDGARNRSLRVKISTVVAPQDLSLFFPEYTRVITRGARGLRGAK